MRLAKTPAPLTYFDNSATSFPKPTAVAMAVTHYLLEVGGNYGRSSHARSFKASSIVEQCREKLAELMDISIIENLCFAQNATHAANVILQGLSFPEGAEVLVSPMEHNAVARPLKMLENQGRIKLRTLPAHRDGLLKPGELRECITKRTALVVINHQSNVNGVIQPIADIKPLLGDIPLLADVSQSLGKHPVKVDRWGIDYLIFTGHKGLLGPTGTGGFYLRQPDQVNPFYFGGTGSNSDSLLMPEVMPDRFEAGTPNIAGIAGLLAALNNPVAPAHSPEEFTELTEAIAGLEGFRIYTATNAHARGEVISITHDRLDAGTLSWSLEKQYGISTRSGLHCSPLAHRHLDTYPDGTCRISTSPMHTGDDFRYLLNALQTVAREND